MASDSESHGITEQSGMKPVWKGKNLGFFSASKKDTMKLVHRYICHTSVGTLERMERIGVATGLDIVTSTTKLGHTFEACVDGKATNASHPRHIKSKKRVLELMHTDVTGPIDQVRAKRRTACTFAHR